MAGAAVSPVLPLIQETFRYTPGGTVKVKLLLTLPAIFIALFAPLAGHAADRWGRKPLLISGLILFVLAGTSGLYLPTLTSLLVCRALLGVSVAAVMTAAATMVVDLFESEHRGRFLSIQGAASSVGGILFIVGSGLLSGLSWRWAFAIYGLAIPLIPLSWIALRETRVQHRYQIQEEEDAAAADTIMAFEGAGVMPSSPLTPYPTSPLRPNMLVFATAIIAMMIFYLGPVQLPFFIKENFGAGAKLISLALATQTVCSAFSSAMYARIRAFATIPQVALATFILLSLSLIIFGSSTTLLMVFVGQAVQGLGMGWVMPNLNFWLAEITKPERRGRAVGILNGSLFLGQFLSPLAAQPLVSVFGWETMWFCGAAICMVFVLVFVFLKDLK